MPPVDAATLADLAIRLNLISSEQWRECHEDADMESDEPAAALRILERKALISPYQASKLLKGDTDGYFLGGYRLLYRISAGTFGRVYRADNPQTGEVVAIKVLRRKWSNDPHKTMLFEREGKVGLSLKHPNIVQILAVNKDLQTGQHYIVMEFVEGGNLRDIVTIRKKVEPVEALRILEDAAEGLAYAATRGLSHRDIKLTNILLSTLGVAKLVDFGLAEISGPATTPGDDELNVDRTVDYAGLERATSVKQGDPRSDIYFLGCTFFEMLTGRPLLSVTKDPRERMMKHRFNVSSQLRRDDPDVPPAIYSLLSRMVAFEPGERYQNASQVVEAVKHARSTVTGETIQDRSPAGPKTVFVVEHHPKLQDVFRDKLKRLGYRVLISIDVNRACERYLQQPYHAFIVDVGTTGEDGLQAMGKVLSEAAQQSRPCTGILLLSEEQADWEERASEIKGAIVFVRPVTMKDITNVLRENVPVPPPEEKVES